MSKIGITTTIPVEIVFAAGHVPVDLNNIFITAPDPERLIENAEIRGFPRNLCSWVKGIYGVLQAEEGVDEIIAVVEGDCSNSCALMEITGHEGRIVHSFSYPFNRDREKLDKEMKKLAALRHVSWGDVDAWKEKLDRIRAKTHLIDRLTWEKGTVSGYENHLYLINTSDFLGDPVKFERDIDAFLGRIQERTPADPSSVRLGIVGVPPIFSNLHEALQERGARVVYNEVQRQFSMPMGGGSMAEQYLNYTYPYGIKNRVDDIKNEAGRRGLEGIIHYTQMFCHHQMEHMILKESIPLPLLLLEGDRPGPLDERTILRIESFLEMIR